MITYTMIMFSIVFYVTTLKIGDVAYQTYYRQISNWLSPDYVGQNFKNLWNKILRKKPAFDEFGDPIEEQVGKIIHNHELSYYKTGMIFAGDDAGYNWDYSTQKFVEGSGNSTMEIDSVRGLQIYYVMTDEDGDKSGGSMMVAQMNHWLTNNNYKEITRKSMATMASDLLADLEEVHF